MRRLQVLFVEGRTVDEWHRLAEIAGWIGSAGTPSSWGSSESIESDEVAHLLKNVCKMSRRSDRTAIDTTQ